MKSYHYKNSSKKSSKNNSLWDAFNNHLESVYFPGAADLLDIRLVAYEYETFKNMISF